jgi:hypothetical protein
MPKLPAVPYFCCSNPNSGYFDMMNRVDTTVKASRLALLGDGDSHGVVYDSEGVVWNYRWERPKKRPGMWAEVIAQVYNPVSEVNVAWARVREYPFDELRKVYLEAVELDDDILTQFVDGDELTERIKRALDFFELVDVWNWSNTDQDFE